MKNIRSSNKTWKSGRILSNNLGEGVECQIIKELPIVCTNLI